MHKNNHASQHICLWCLNPLYHDSTLFDLFIPLRMLCHACHAKIPKNTFTYSLEELQCESMVLYDQEIEQLLFRYKEDGDLPLAPTFFFYARKKFKKYKNCVFVLMPSSSEKTRERGFHALEFMISKYITSYCLPLKKTQNVKQSEQSAQSRKNISKSIVLSDLSIIENKHIILIDDVCTTGSTLLSAYKLIKPHAQSVRAFTFAASSMLFQKH